MDFNEDYFKARAEAVKWLNRDISRRSYTDGVAILGRMGFKPLLHRRLSMHQGNHVLMATLDKALRDGCNVYRNPTNPKYADILPPEVEVMDSGTHQPPSEDKAAAEEDGDTEKFKAFPETVRTVVRWYAKAYKLRAVTHRHLRAVGEGNDAASCERRKQLSDQIDALSDYMDRLYPLKKAYDRQGTIPTKEEVDAIGPMGENNVRPEPEKVDDSKSSFKSKGEDYSKMTKEQLRTRKHSTRTSLVRKQNQLLYQSTKVEEKENPMPFCPARTKLEVQVELLKDKLYNIDKALARFG